MGIHVWFPILAFLNCAATEMQVQTILSYACYVLFRYTPRNGMPGSYGRLMKQSFSSFFTREIVEKTLFIFQIIIFVWFTYFLQNNLLLLFKSNFRGLVFYSTCNKDILITEICLGGDSFQGFPISITNKGQCKFGHRSHE